MTHRKPLFFFVLALAITLCAPVWAAPALDLSANGGEVTWASDVAFDNAYLRVTGPYGYVHEAKFSSSDVPSFFADGLEDGRYSWSLLMVTNMSDSALAQLEAARAEGAEERVLANLRLSGSFTSNTLSGSFLKEGFSLIVPELETLQEDAGIVAKAGDAGGRAATKDNVINDDLIVTFSLCVGNDCVNGENFGFDTIRMKENNIRVHFDDTSSSASFPNNDWRLIANDSDNGGDNYLAIEDSTAGRQIFRVDAGAPANSLRVDSAGDVGIGTSNPIVDVHVVSGNTPTLRLEQNGSSGFTAQTYDIAANEANFFIRDVTNGSKLFFRAKPDAPEDSLYINSNGNIGFGTDTPDTPLDIEQDLSGTYTRYKSTASAQANIFSSYEQDDCAQSTDNCWDAGRASGGNFVITLRNSGQNDFAFSPAGNMSVQGTVIAAGFQANGVNLDVPDYVFADEYELRTLDELQSFIDANSHLPNVPSAKEVNSGNLDLPQFSLSLLEKIEELTLYTLQQEEKIRALEERLNGEDAAAQE